MNKQSQYQKYRETILAYGKTRVECECGDTLNRNSLSKHKKSQKHKDKVGDGAPPNSIQWFMEGYGSSDSEEDDEECAECCNCGEDVSNDNGTGSIVGDEYWCKTCVEEEEESEEEEEEEEIVLEKGTFTKDIVFQCSGCFEGIVRDSKKHDECLMIKNVWICGQCYLTI